MTGQKPQKSRIPEPARLGPRPLPLHLMAASLTWASSRSALPLWNSGSLPWKGELAERAENLRQRLKASGDPEASAGRLEAFSGAVEKEVARRMATLFEGIEAYRHHPYRRRLTDPPVLWSEGSTRLLDYGALAGAAKDARPLLVIPSLINRAYVLDLTAERSFLRWLAGQGLRPLLVDWGHPAAMERVFTLTDYIAGRLERALDFVLQESGRRPLALGYCMGGLLALGLAARRQADLPGLVLMATPWDFHAENAPHSRLAAATLPLAAPLLEIMGEMPVDLLQALFSSLDPHLVVRKFLAFAKLDQTSAKADNFVALEDWLNDGIPLAAAVARECLGRWYGDNATAQGRWLLAGTPVDPAKVTLPSLCVIPAQDRIVPPASALALAAALPAAETASPAVGHIGMVVSGQARTTVWEPMLQWITEQPADSR
ncbi:alpha/beta fold hydrolase [Pelagibius litoralis]|uniref:Alpha/beta fold hydrolase n=1 Tax=Pelagibius litoralis TaxID=374515 RepID=A0A967C8G8_9PROT|nr:alpha/beta fold hydrolase [Pelagibius litoralis]NIA68392.1 alpha/beta fold hydrolase [Pelagibius litoralis]